MNICHTCLKASRVAAALGLVTSTQSNFRPVPLLSMRPTEILNGLFSGILVVYRINSL